MVVRGLCRASVLAPAQLSGIRPLVGYMQSGLKRMDDTREGFHRNIMPQLDAAYNFACFLSRDADAAQDIVQEAFLRAYRGYDGYQGGSARAWVFTIVRNCYQDWLNGRRRKARVEDNSSEIAIDDVPSEQDSPEAALVRKEEPNTVRTVIDALPRSLREVLVLRELEGFSYRQIAELAALPIGTVMSRLSRARKEFADAWRREEIFQGNPIPGSLARTAAGVSLAETE
jgi:RNA polymerase sigma factor (sigma-70 family)